MTKKSKIGEFCKTDNDCARKKPCKKSKCQSTAKKTKKLKSEPQNIDMKCHKFVKEKMKNKKYEKECIDHWSEYLFNIFIVLHDIHLQKSIRLLKKEIGIYFSKLFNHKKLQDIPINILTLEKIKLLADNNYQFNKNKDIQKFYKKLEDKKDRFYIHYNLLSEHINIKKIHSDIIPKIIDNLIINNDLKTLKKIFPYRKSKFNLEIFFLMAMPYDENYFQGTRKDFIKIIRYIAKQVTNKERDNIMMGSYMKNNVNRFIRYGNSDDVKLYFHYFKKFYGKKKLTKFINMKYKSSFGGSERTLLEAVLKANQYYLGDKKNAFKKLKLILKNNGNVDNIIYDDTFNTIIFYVIHKHHTMKVLKELNKHIKNPIDINKFTFNINSNNNAISKDEFQQIFKTYNKINDKYFNILKISPSADKNTIKKAYKKLAMKYHPDRKYKTKESNENDFKKINRAYNVLLGNENPSPLINE